MTPDRASALGPDRRFAERVRAGDTLIGSFVNTGSSVVAEIMGLAGFDWLVLDLEHGAGGPQATLPQLQALSAFETAALVRLSELTPAGVNHALDAGAAGVLVPRIATADDVRRAVASTRYGGSRGVARYNRAAGWGLSSRSLAEVDSAVVCAVQIETRSALDDVEAIASVDGVDVLFVGPLDLSHALGVEFALFDSELHEHLASVVEAARGAGKAAGILVGTVDDARRCAELGFTIIGCSSDSALVAGGAAEIVDALTRRPT